jgi:RNA polymerase sigma-70 factor
VTTSDDPGHAAVRAAIERDVRCRFSLSAASFADLVLGRAHAHQPDGDPRDYVARLCLDELYLAVACSRGEEAAWRECRERFFAYIRDFAKRFVHERAAADVADQVIADLWQRGRIAKYDGRSTLRTWLGAVVAHAAINAGKAERRMIAFEPPMMERPPAPADAIEDVETRRAFAALVAQAIAGLEPEGKLLLLLYYEQGLTLDQMEGVVGVSKATLSRRLDRLRRGLREAIETSARRDLRLDAEALRERLDLGRLEFDLAAALDGSMKGTGHGAV